VGTEEVSVRIKLLNYYAFLFAHVNTYPSNRNSEEAKKILFMCSFSAIMKAPAHKLLLLGAPALQDERCNTEITSRGRVGADVTTYLI